MADYRILTYTGAGGAPMPGIAVGDRVVDLAAACNGRGVGFSTVSNVAMLQNWDADGLFYLLTDADDGALWRLEPAA